MRKAAWFPMGLETLVSAGGLNFSGGQRQLIALTAVFASSRSVLLLDEAFANLDGIAKEKLFRCSQWKGKSVILASHEDCTGRTAPEQYGFVAHSMPALAAS